jgi:hypothetical protein
MTPTQSLLDALGWSRDYAAVRCGVTPAQMRWWAQGINSRGNPCHTPPWVVTHLRAALAAMEALDAALPHARP